MGCPPQSFTTNRATFDKLKVQVQAAGFSIPSNAGSAVYHGCTIRWGFDEAVGQLTLVCTDKPWYAPCSYINSQLAGWVEKASQ